VSKGLSGECGLRGGYFELKNFDMFAKEMVYKLKSINLCSNTIGQISVGLMLNPPREGRDNEETVRLYREEEKSLLDTLKLKAHMITDGLNSMDKISC
jgi:aspartate/methionine/tyrosine aminotransferase